MRRCLLPALTALVFFGSVDEQAAAKGWEFDCKYGRFAQDLEGPRATDFNMRFHFDDITNKAVVVGNNGVSDVSVYRGKDAITFMELLETGAVHTTTISLKTGRSIHSRHTTMSPDGVPLPSQYLGSFVSLRVHSALILSLGRLLTADRERPAMITFIHFFRRLIHHNDICPVPDALLRDIGLSRLVGQLPITRYAGSEVQFSRRATGRTTPASMK